MPTEVMDSFDDSEFNYYCPIHPEILKDNPGVCSQSGMPLAKDSTNGEWGAKPL